MNQGEKLDFVGCCILLTGLAGAVALALWLGAVFVYKIQQNIPKCVPVEVTK